MAIERGGLDNAPLQFCEGSFASLIAPEGRFSKRLPPMRQPGIKKTGLKHIIIFVLKTLSELNPFIKLVIVKEIGRSSNDAQQLRRTSCESRLV